MTPADGGWQSTPFGRLAMVNLTSSAGDALVLIALAGSVFVSVPLHAARGRTALGLLCTLLPFAVVAPVIGPAADRSRRGKRFVLFLAAAGRTAAAVMMVAWLHSLLLFPAAFLSLVCSKTHAVARSALVPGYIPGPPEFVRANSRLVVGSGLAAAGAAAVGSAIYALFGSGRLLEVDAFVFASTAALSLMLPAPSEPGAGLTAEATGPDRGRRPAHDLGRSSLVMGGTRAMTGFITALIAFGFRATGTSLIWYGLAAAAAVVGNLSGAVAAPRARRLVRSEAWMVALSSVAIAAAAAALVVSGAARHPYGAVMLAAGAGLAATVAKNAFDAQVQADVEAANRARAFGRFDAGFQCGWVLAALVPTLIAVPMTAGFTTVGTVQLILGAGLMVHLLRRRDYRG
ncbi:MAG TPA: hypothetical protein VFN68_04850 [Acidimicrobiales bacterium]|nr:hypothetical protein [Acidimicrobiales bacterium]